MSHRFLVLLVLLFPLVSHAQIDQRKLDSLKKSIDSSAAAHREWQDSFSKVQDSVYQDAVKKAVNGDNISRDHHIKKVESRRIVQGIVIVLAIVIAVVLLFLYRRTKST
ncbi:MAG: hypothetical protein ACXVLT_00980 [Flavisolibacter sp.]